MTPAAVTGWDSAGMIDHLDQAVTIYCIAMGYPPHTGAARRPLMAMHTALPGFRAVACWDTTDQLVGFGYGYTGAAGQWWHEQVSRGLDDSSRRRWLGDSFELCELHLLPNWHGHGLGRSMLELLLRDCPHRTVLLSTPEGTARAWRLYRAAGFDDVLRNYRFVGDLRDFAVLGRTLPLDPPALGAESCRTDAPGA